MAADLAALSGESPFDALMGEDGRWSARDLARALAYSEFRWFESCALKAREAIATLEGDVSAGRHIDEVLTAYAAGFGKKQIKDYRLTRYGAYMALGYSTKPELKHYFAVKTREAEMRPAFDPAQLTRKQILTMALEAEERAELAIAERDEMREIVAVNEPKVAAYDAFIDDDGLLGIREVARLLRSEGFDIAEREFTWLLREWNVIDKYGTAGKAQHVEAGRMANKAIVLPNGDTRVQGKFTRKGVDYVVRKLHGRGDARRA